MGPGMGMQMRPEMRQQMILAPRMIQSMEILQLPIMALQDYLNDQLAFLEAAPAQMKLLRFLITHIDENGYLTQPLEEIAKGYDEPLTPAQLEEVLHMVQKLDPPGVGARKLEECLLLQ